MQALQIQVVERPLQQRQVNLARRTQTNVVRATLLDPLPVHIGPDFAVCFYLCEVGRGEHGGVGNRNQYIPPLGSRDAQVVVGHRQWTACVKVINREIIQTEILRAPARAGKVEAGGKQQRQPAHADPAEFQTAQAPEHGEVHHADHGCVNR